MQNVAFLIERFGLLAIFLNVLVSAGGQPITSAQALQGLMFADAIDRQLPITVVRNGALVDVIATPVELTTEPSDR